MDCDMERSPRAQTMIRAWDDFVDAAKFRSRYFFHALQSCGPDGKDRSPNLVFRTLRSISGPSRLIKRFSVASPFYRARIFDGTWGIDNKAEFMAPPREKASAGRMNPAGISYLYLAEEPGTAVAEVVERPPCKIAVSQFSTLIDLTVLDITNIPDPDPKSDRDKQDALHLLHHFREAILQPVEKGSQEHIDYVPSQIVCEFFAQAHELPSVVDAKAEPWPRLHGIRYPSVICPGGINVALFPPTSIDLHNDFKEMVECMDNTQNVFEIKTWGDLVSHVPDLSTAQSNTSGESATRSPK